MLQLSPFCRVSCEAIPEEISGFGTTPPAGDSEENIEMEASSHPQLLSCHSYPGPGLTHSPTQPPAATRTVPQSPTSMVSDEIHGIVRMQHILSIYDMECDSIILQHKIQIS